MINGALESLVQKVHSGVVIHFEKFGPDPSPATEGEHGMVRTDTCLNLCRARKFMKVRE